MSKIFFSYRREDSPGDAGRIYDRLRAHFGDDTVFMDIDSIPFGVDFREHIDAAIRQCDVVLAVIGTKWAGETSNHRRLDDPKDFVRIEIESALLRGIPVIPILIDHTSMPTEADLPPSLAKLAYLNGTVVNQGRDFHPHVDRLVQGIEFHFPRAKISDAPPSSQPGKPAKLRSNGNENDQDLLDRRGSDGLNSRTSPKPADAIDVASILSPAPAAPIRQRRDIPPQLDLAAPTPRKIFWLRFCLATLPVLAFLGIIIHIVTDYGTVKISGTAPDMMVRIDGEEIRIENLSAPITLRKGPHDLLVTRGDLVAKTQTFQIRRGQETPLEVTSKPSLIDPDGDKKAASPSPSVADGSKQTHSTTQVKSFTQKSPPPRPGREWTNSIGIKFVRIEAGEFLMGSLDSDPSAESDEKPPHHVRISKPFYIGIYEVTQGQYRSVVGDNPSNFKGLNDRPVENVSWLDAVEFCNKLSEVDNRTPFYRINGTVVTIIGGEGYRLPTEAEWEYACRAGSGARYPFGDDADILVESAWYDKNSESKTRPVGEKLPNARGIHDMLGNVWEWCGDWCGETYYTSSPASDPLGPPSASDRVYRGGGWGSGPRFCRSANRDGSMPTSGSIALGFRLSLSKSGR